MMTDYGGMVRRLFGLGGSSNVEDVTAYPPRIAPHGTTGMRTGLYFYDPKQGKYVDAFNDMLVALIRKGIASRKEREVGKYYTDTEAEKTAEMYDRIMPSYLRQK